MCSAFPGEGQGTPSLLTVLRSGEKQEGVEDSPGQLRGTGHTLQPEKLRTMVTFVANVMGVGPVPQSHLSHATPPTCLVECECAQLCNPNIYFCIHLRSIVLTLY